MTLFERDCIVTAIQQHSLYVDRINCALENVQFRKSKEMYFMMRSYENEIINTIYGNLHASTDQLNALHMLNQILPQLQEYL